MMVEITAEELAKQVKGKLEGDGGRVIRGVARLAEAGPEDLSWVGSPVHFSSAKSSQAGVFLVPIDCPTLEGRTVICVEDPDVVICEIADSLLPQPDPVPPGVHSSAIIDPTARVENAAIGPHVYVGPDAVVGEGSQLHCGVYIGSNARIGANCVLWPSVVVRERCLVGDRVVIHPNSTIGADGFGYLQRHGQHRKIPQVGIVVIEDDVEIGADTTIDRARLGLTKIGKGTKIDNLVHIAHNVQIGEGCLITGLCGISGSSTLGKGVVMGGNAGVVDHVHVGDGVQIAARATVTKDIPAGTAVMGYPAIQKMRALRDLAHYHKLSEYAQQLYDLEQRITGLEKHR